MSDSRNARADAYAELKTIFDVTVEAYLEVLELPLVACGNIEPEAPKARVLNALGVDYKVDVEHAVESVLKSEAQQRAFFALLRGEKANSVLTNAVIRKVAKVFKERGLTPVSYFRQYRRGGVPLRRAA